MISRLRLKLKALRLLSSNFDAIGFLALILNGSSVSLEPLLISKKM